MKKFAKKFAITSLAATMMATALVGCSGDAGTDNNGTNNNGTTTEGSNLPQGTIIMGSLDMNGVFSPFFGTTAPDMDISRFVHAELIEPSPDAKVQPDLAEVVINEVLGEDGTVAQTVYTFTLKEGVMFSDGTPVTADDVIFSYQVLADPTYDGSSTFSTVPIVGMNDYTKGDATEIAGIVKVDDQTVEVTIEGVDPAAIWTIGEVSIAPKAYYGQGFVKGDLSGVKAVSGAPMGAGPYKFVSYENNVVSLEANELYFEGAPQTAKLKVQFIATANKLEVVRLGDVDISDPSSSPEMRDDVEEAGIEYRIVDNLGYGYIGINAERITDINVRKGLMHLMNRGPAVEQYYGDLAQVIERPMSTVSWAYPHGVEEFYGFNPDAALEYFTAAGYAQVDGKLVKDGEQLRLEVGIPGGGVMDHPTAPVLTQMKTELEKIGGVLEITDTDGAIFFDRLNAEGWDMWVAAWQSDTDPDMYQLYHSEGPSNRYNIESERLDELIVLARQTNDMEQRKAYYAEALDLIMDEAVEMPVYQRTNMYIYNGDIIDTTSIPADMTAYYTHYHSMNLMSTK